MPPLRNHGPHPEGWTGLFNESRSSTPVSWVCSLENRLSLNLLGGLLVLGVWVNKHHGNRSALSARQSRRYTGASHNVPRWPPCPRDGLIRLVRQPVQCVLWVIDPECRQHQGSKKQDRYIDHAGLRDLSHVPASPPSSFSVHFLEDVL
ncbi:hypothetical protein H107_02161 [Trichophyton rubrum CBS 202.88]|nr:hypothetical protein H102_02089 [Trichophyton rubrum CBS 100081]EZG19548.1 hypothetical protein H107_02161 [Trichophyton rubrum CBS 202.88]